MDIKDSINLREKTGPGDLPTFCQRIILLYCLITAILHIIFFITCGIVPVSIYIAVLILHKKIFHCITHVCGPQMASIYNNIAPYE